MIVGVVPVPASAWPGLAIPEFGYFFFQITRGVPFFFALKRYIFLAEAM